MVPQCPPTTGTAQTTTVITVHRTYTHRRRQSCAPSPDSEVPLLSKTVWQAHSATRTSPAISDAVHAITANATKKTQTAGREGRQKQLHSAERRRHSRSEQLASKNEVGVTATAASDAQRHQRSSIHIVVHVTHATSQNTTRHSVASPAARTSPYLKDSGSRKKWHPRAVALGAWSGVVVRHGALGARSVCCDVHVLRAGVVPAVSGQSRRRRIIIPRRQCQGTRERDRDGPR